MRPCFTTHRGAHLLIAILASGCATGPAVYLQEVPTSSEPGRVAGVIRHASTAEVLPGLRVVLEAGKNSDETTTDTRGRFELTTTAGGPDPTRLLVFYDGSEVARAFALEIDDGIELNFWLDPSATCPTVTYWKRASVPATRPRSERVVGYLGGCGADK